MKTFEKVFEDPDWFLKVTATDASGSRLETYTKFADEAAIDTFLTTTVGTLTTRKTELESAVTQLTAEIAAINALITP